MSELMCQNCQKHPGTEFWVAEGGALALVHGFGQWWCKVCVIEAQLQYARERASHIPSLEAELQRLTEASS